MKVQVRFESGPKGPIARPDYSKFVVPEGGFNPVIGDLYEVEIVRDTAPGERRGVLIAREVQNLSAKQRVLDALEAEFKQCLEASAVARRGRFLVEDFIRAFAGWPEADREAVFQEVIQREKPEDSGPNWRRGFCWRPNNGRLALNFERWIEVDGPDGFLRVEDWTCGRLYPTGERENISEVPFAVVDPGNCCHCKALCIGEVTFPDATGNPEGWWYDWDKNPLHHKCREDHSRAYAGARRMAERD